MTMAELSRARRAGESLRTYADRMAAAAGAAELERRRLAAALDRAETQLAEQTPTPPLLAEVLGHHVERLRELAAANYTDAGFCSGLAWGLWALARVRLAAGGVTDALQLGMAERPSAWRSLTPPDPRSPAPTPREDGTPVLALQRYQLPAAPQTGIDMPAGAVLLHVGPSRLLGDQIELWALADPEAPRERRRFAVVLTGYPLPDGVDPASYVASVVDGAREWHVFTASPAPTGAGAER